MALFPLPVTVEILINGTFRDISSFVRQADGINITGGSQTKTPGDKPQPATCTMTLDNRDGRFSPNNSSGAYYPYLKRNIQLRVSINGATSSSGNTYSGYRFWGEVKTWPPMSDITATDIFVSITAHGPLRRLRQHGGKGSALARYYAALTGSAAPIAYWACEEDPDTSQVQSSLSGGSNMSVTGTPKWKAISNFNGSAPIGVLNKSTWDGLTGSYGSSGNEIYSTPGTFQFLASTTTVDVTCIGAGGGGANGGTGAGGGGGEWRKTTGLAVTPGNFYTFIVGAGGAGGFYDPSASNPGSDGTLSKFTGDAASVIANPGHGNSGSTGGAGGSGGTGTTGHNGGAGGSNPSNFQGGSGGGGSGGSAAAGNAGTGASGNSGAAGGAAVAGGGKGGNGGAASPQGQGGFDGVSPGGGGGGGADDASSHHNRSGGAGASGSVQIQYTPASTPSVNVMRFIIFVPKHGGNNGKVLARFVTGATKFNTVDVTYVTGGKLRVQGFDSTPTQTFDSGAQSWSVDGTTVMVSVELQNSGANVAWAFRAIQPGSKTLIGSATGTVTTAAVGNVSEVKVGPNQDITKTAMGHFSVQYALIDLRKVSRHLHGHTEEIGVHRFMRLCNEEAMGNEPGYKEASDHFGFESGTQSWVVTNGALTNPTTTATAAFDYNFVLAPISGVMSVWPSEGTHSLLLTCNGAGSPSTSSPTGTGGLNVLAGDRVGVAGHFYTPAAAANMYIGIKWYNAAGTLLSETDAADYASSAGEIFTMTHHDTAPINAAFFAVVWGNHGTLANTTQLFADDITVHPKFGRQTRKKVHEFLEEIKDLDQGIMRESRKLWGLGYRTRINLINQSPAVTLDFSTGIFSDTLAPVHDRSGMPNKPKHKMDPGGPIRRGHHHQRHHRALKATVDDHSIFNDITVHRHKGSKIRVTLENGAVSVREPPDGAGRHRRHLKLAAHADEQLLAIATHLLNLGTVQDERYPVVGLNLGRAGITGNPTAPLMSAIAGVECGDYIQITNLPFWFPSATAKQLVIGYTETINAFEWTINWNCTPESPYEITLTNLRRW